MEAFFRCYALEEVIVPEGTLTIGGSAFAYCSGLESVELPGSMTTLGNSAFYGCSLLTSVEIREGLEGIAGSAFDGCSSLETIELPRSLSDLGNGVFVDCDSLVSILFKGDAPSVSMLGAPPETIVYFYDGASGFTEPTWKGYQTQRLAAPGDGAGDPPGDDQPEGDSLLGIIGLVAVLALAGAAYMFMRRG